MAQIKPFKALRPVTDKVYEVSSKPYETLTVDQLKQEFEDHYYSIINIVRPNVNLTKDFEDNDDIIYDQARFNLLRLIKEGVLQDDQEAGYYVYEQKIGDQVKTCFLGLCSIEDYQNEVVKKHEMTLPKKEEKIISYTRRVEVQPAPVFLTYPSVSEIDFLLNQVKNDNEALYAFTTSSGNEHTIWQLKDESALAQLSSIFEEKVPKLYIADGHHRAASALRWAKLRRSSNPSHTGKEAYNYFFSVFFSSNQIDIVDYNRVVKDLNGNTKEELIQKISHFFEVKLVDTDFKPSQYHEIGMYINKECYALVPKEGIYNEASVVDSLDVSILQDNLLSPILGIIDPRTDKRIDFVSGREGFEGIKVRVDSGEFEVAFTLFPVSIKQFFDIADSGNIMPPKSTWFEPKLRTGVIVRRIEA